MSDRTAPIRRRAQADRDVAAQRALLADPAVIAAGGTAAVAPSAPSTRNASETARRRPKSARPAHRASRPAPAPDRTPRARPADDGSAAPPSGAPDPVPHPRTALLDATRARRLAREARLRERDRRDALARAHAAFDAPIDSGTIDASHPPAAAPRPRSAPVARPDPLGSPAAPSWQRRALVSTPAATTQSMPAVEGDERAAPRAATSLVERALAAELREARATLAIARETAQLQREEIARLRAQRTTAAARPLEPSAPIPSDDERLRLARRVEALETERAERERERGQLLESLARHERERAERERQLDALNDRLEVESQALDRTRRELEQERRRHTDAQQLLAHLRTALRGLDVLSSASDSEPLDEAVPSPLAARSAEASIATAVATPTIAITTPATAPATPPGAQATASPAAPGSPAESPAAPPAAEASPVRRSAIFEHWRESQIRRHFGAFGIDGTADLVRDPLARRTGAADHAVGILLLGPGAWAASRPLAEALLRGATHRFVLHVADPGSTALEPPPDEDPLGEMRTQVEVPTSPTALAALIRRLAPAVIVSRDFLTGRSEPAGWLDALETAIDSQACLVLLEATGQGQVALGPEVEAIGERIWELLPERYTRDAASGRAVASFREAFAACPTAPSSSLLAALRARFEFELFAQFGLLAEAFVAGPVADCFDPASARDRRFLEQIAELDDRRVEAGAGPALHLVARVDPLSAS